MFLMFFLRFFRFCDFFVIYLRGKTVLAFQFWCENLKKKMLQLRGSIKNHSHCICIFYKYLPKARHGNSCYAKKNKSYNLRSYIVFFF
jgi:hypothetical protein